MDLFPSEEETKHSWERRQRIVYKHYLCSWGQFFCDEASKSLPPCSFLPLTTPSAFQLAASDVSLFISLLSTFPQSFHGASSSCTSVTPPSHSCKLAISPHTWEPYGKGSLGDGALSKTALSPRTFVLSLPPVLLGSSQPLALWHSWMTSPASHNFHYALLLSGCLNPPAIQSWICSPPSSCLLTNTPINSLLISSFLMHSAKSISSGINKGGWIGCSVVVFFPLDPLPQVCTCQIKQALVWSVFNKKISKQMQGVKGIDFVK